MPVVITDKNQLVLESLAKYYVLSRSMIQEICFPHVRSARSVCERLRKLKNEGYISQASMEVVLQGRNATPVYFPNKKTGETLAAIYDNPEFENIYTKPPSGRLLFHWLEISRMHVLVDNALELFGQLEMPTWYNEWEPINKDALNRNQLFSLYTELQNQPPISCAPDAGFLLEFKGHRKVFYLEVDRGTDSMKRIAKKKPKGYAQMQNQNRHMKHFPGATVPEFSVLFVTTTKYRRDELVRRAEDFEGKELWKFAWDGDVKPSSFFFDPIWHSVEQDRNSLVQA